MARAVLDRRENVWAACGQEEDYGSQNRALKFKRIMNVTSCKKCNTFGKKLAPRNQLSFNLYYFLEK